MTLQSGDSATFTATVTVAANAAQGSLANTATVATVARSSTRHATTAQPTPTGSWGRCRPGGPRHFNRRMPTPSAHWSQATLSARLDPGQRTRPTPPLEGVWNSPVTPSASARRRLHVRQRPGRQLGDAERPPQGKRRRAKGVLHPRQLPGGNVQVSTTTNSGGPYLPATFAATFAVNDKLGAATQSDGTVTVFKNGVVGRPT